MHAITSRAKRDIEKATEAFLESPAEFIVSSLGDHAGAEDGVLVQILDDAETVAGLLSDSLETGHGSIYNRRGAYLLNRKLNLAKQIAAATHSAALEYAKREVQS